MHTDSRTPGREPRGRQFFTIALVMLATVFGMMLVGGYELVPPSFADTSNPELAVSVTPSAAAPGLPSFADLAESVSEAVVSIQAVKIERAGGRDGGTNPLEFFFGPRNRDRRSPQQPQVQPEGRRADSSGSGFVISADGLIVTNHHVIEDADSLVVRLGDRPYDAEVVGDDPATDIALLKIEADEPLTYLEFADSEQLRVGDWVMVIGSPLQLTNSVSVGVVSAKGRSINVTPDRSLENFIQTDAAINFGNSGGPLVDLQGRVIGIATAINFGAENIGFAVPVNTLKTILPQLRETGSVRRGYLGINIADITFEYAAAWGLEDTRGALVVQVVEGGPAAAAGIEHGDIVLKVDDTEIADNRELIEYVSSRRPGSDVELTVNRNGEMLQKTVTLGTRDGGDAVPLPVEDDAEGAIEWLGIQYQDITQQVRQSHNMPSDLDGVWITAVAPDSPLYDQNLRPNDVIVELNGAPVGGVADFEQRLGEASSGSYLRLYVSRFDPRRGTSVGSFFAVVQVP